MNTFDKEDYKTLKDIAKESNTRIISVNYSKNKELNSDYFASNGITIAYRSMTKDGKMIAVSVSYCSKEDKFKKKIGKYNALYKLEDGQFVQLPLNNLFKYDPSTLEELLKDTFNL